ncbi:hypothetical protein [Polaromonas sp. AER18D-145]|uniref:hypothetical protein n=1 Tax=Polaromonas sp. AER18D-145 TaxID=1977060 RepID=UPI000BBC42DC|nr:hypothetical protein [Polaromonas sp. AER18D-145]
MKKLVLLALSAVATAAMATGPTPASEITIRGNSAQIAVLSTTGVVNTANGSDSVAQQNLASNAGDVTISGNSLQIVAARGSYVGNTANADTMAQQNLSSNVGDVTVSGNSLQATLLHNSYVLNSATGRDASAVQNIASNNACFTCPTTGGGHGGGHGGH